MSLKWPKYDVHLLNGARQYIQNQQSAATVNKIELSTFIQL